MMLAPQNETFSANDVSSCGEALRNFHFQCQCYFSTSLHLFLSEFCFSNSLVLFLHVLTCEQLSRSGQPSIIQANDMSESSLHSAGYFKMCVRSPSVWLTAVQLLLFIPMRDSCLVFWLHQSCPHREPLVEGIK